VNVDLKRLEKEGLQAISKPFDEEHTRLFTFALPLEHEFVSLRAVVHGKGVNITRQKAAVGKSDPSAAAVGKQKVFMEGRDYTAIVYDRAKLKAGARVPGPAIVMEMDSTSVILPKHTGLVDAYANILIYPDGHAALKGQAKAKPKAKVKAKTKVKAKPAR
jgi:N-methylhydantoinase A